ncbi:MAG: hypothetical protein VX246_16925 [Myxococcota bacterium]|nr:hypothetical protein [Myxococcota bacterium]
MFNPPRFLVTALLICSVHLVALHAPALAETPAVPGLDPFDGAWERVAIEEDDAQRLSSIDSAISGLSWLVRRMAAPILRSTTSPPTRYEFVVTEPDLLLGQRGKEPRPLPLDGREQSGAGPRGAFKSLSSFEDGVIETEWVVTDARGSNRYTVSEDGETLVVHHMIQITTLAGVEPIRYRSHFQRTPGVASGPAADAD